MGESGTSTKAKGARLAAGSGAILSLGASLVATAGPAGAASFEVTTTADSGAGSLRQAIIDANANGEADTITFAPGLGTITLTTGDIDVTEDLVLTDPEGDVTIDAGGNSRIFYLTNAGDVTISGLTLTNGTSSGLAGGAIRSADTDLTITDSTFTGNVVDGTEPGGGLELTGGSLTVTGSTFDQNAGSFGGGIFVYDAPSVAITDSTFSSNDASYVGGGLIVFNADSVAIAGSTFSDNNAEDWGGGGASIDNSATVAITDSTFTGNTADDQGGGVLAADLDSLTITSSTFDDNHGQDDQGFTIGGGIAADNVGTVLVDSSTVSGNSASFGGGVAGIFSDLTVVNSTISGNDADDSGGGIGFYGDDNSLEVRHTTISGNEAGVGGGVFVSGQGGDATFDHDILDGNLTSGAVPVATEPVFDDEGSAIFVTTADPEVEAQALDSTTLTNNLVNGTIAGEIIDGGGNQFDVPANLGPLADNGGPTRTHDLLAGSAALDTGDAAFAAPPATDQRGLPRVSNGRVDIGAVEVQVQTPVVPPVTPPVAPPAQPVPAAPDFTG